MGDGQAWYQVEADARLAHGLTLNHEQ
jgi:hypothetical protein